MELTEHVKPAPKVETVRTYTPEEEGTFVEMVNGGSFVEEIAEALGKSVNSIRGKALSLLRSGEINAIPKQKETKGSSKADVLADIDISGMTVEEIADSIGKTVRGVKTMLTRRGLQCSDYNGAAKKEIG
jgi:DNA-directed RNA polymerase specialized sigma24 family protein